MKRRIDMSNIRKKIIAIMLAVGFCITSIPVAAIASEHGIPVENDITMESLPKENQEFTEQPIIEQPVGTTAQALIPAEVPPASMPPSEAVIPVSENSAATGSTTSEITTVQEGTAAGPEGTTTTEITPSSEGSTTSSGQTSTPEITENTSSEQQYVAENSEVAQNESQSNNDEMNEISQTENESSQEEESTVTVYNYEDQDVRITATLNEAEPHVEGMEFFVVQLSPESEVEEERAAYSWAEELLNKYLNEPEQFAVNPVYYDMYFAVNGSRITPDKPVHINIEYKNYKAIDPNANESNVWFFRMDDTLDPKDTHLYAVQPYLETSELGTVIRAEYDVEQYRYTPLIISMLENKEEHETRLAAEEASQNAENDANTENENSGDETDVETGAETDTEGDVFYTGDDNSGDENDAETDTEGDVFYTEDENSGDESGTDEDVIVMTESGEDAGETPSETPSETIIYLEDPENPEGTTDANTDTDINAPTDDVTDNVDMTEQENPEESQGEDQEEGLEESLEEGKVIIQEEIPEESQEETQEEGKEENQEEDQGTRKFITDEVVNTESEEETVTDGEADGSEAEDAEKEDEKEAENKEENKDEAADEDKEEAEVPPTRTYYASLKGDVSVTVILTDPAQVPDSAEIVVTAVTPDASDYNYDAYIEALNNNADSNITYTPENTLLYDISFVDHVYNEAGELIDTIVYEPAEGTVKVQLRFNDNQLSNEIKAENSEDVTVNHLVTDAEADTTAISAEEIAVDPVDANVNLTGIDSVSFSTESFSVYAFTYTVDFHYEVNGKTYDFSIPGGGFVNLTDLIEVLGIVSDTDSEENAEQETAVQADDTQDTAIMLDVTASEEAKKFAADVASVEFTSPELVWVGKAEETTTVGGIKESRGLETEYTVKLTDEQIAAINNSTVEAGDWVLISLLPFTSEEELTVTMKDGEVFTIRVTDAQITTLFLSDSGKLIEVTVTYEDDANIPEGSTLKVTEFAEEDEQYEHARNAVLADKKAKGELVDLSSFGLAAMDISILNPAGEEIEPEAPVQVDIRIKELPGVEDLNEVADTVAIQHHVEVEEGVVVETVFDGSTEASFELETDETVAAEGIAVDPNSVNEEDFAVSETPASNPGEDIENIENDEIEVSFQAPAFSTFTVTWGSAETQKQTRVSQLSNGKYIIYAKDAVENKYYALVPSTALNSVQITLNHNIVQYSGSENLYWDVEVSNGTYYFSFTENGTKYYLAAGKTGDRVKTGTSKTGYGSQNTTNWARWYDYICSAQDTFLQSYYGTFRTWNVYGQYNWGDRSLIYFEKETKAPQVTIHYVDENDNELTISNPYQNLDANSTSPAYLIYDIDGYEYSYTYRNTKTSTISPQLAKNGDNHWMYNPSFSYYTDGSVEIKGTDLSDGDDIYVVYKKKNDITPGGTPTVKQSGSVDPPVAPRINKESTPNGDDTNTLALSLISDTAKLEVEKLADVIVVFDVSGSMGTNDMGNGTTRLAAAKEAVNQLAKHLSEKKNSNGEPLVRMSLIQFSTKASTVLGMTELTNSGRNNGLSQIQSAVNNLSAEGGTNWDHALQLANEENDLDPGRGTFVIFVTDGDPTFRNTRMDVTDLDLQGETNDGAWNNYKVLNPNPFYLDDIVYGPGDNDKTGKCYDAAVIQGRAIVSASKNIYTIGISNDVKKVETFNTAIQGNGAYLASNSTALQKAFADIEASISGTSGWGNIKMTDGITNLTNTVQKTGLTNVGGDFTYWKAPAPENWASMTEAQKNAYKPAESDFVSWDPASEGASPAVYNADTGAVEWNMGNSFMPEAGVTYQVRFKVWPSQEAYDYIAKLNNGTISYEALPSDVQAQIIKDGNKYTLKTNEPDANTTYQEAIKTGSVVKVSGETKTLEFPSVEDLNLSVDKMKVKKEWVNSLDQDARWKSAVTLLLTDGNGTLYKSIDLNESNNYTAEDNFISCGLAKIENGKFIIYETGHDFKLTEPEEYAYYWDLDSQIYRPMIINAQLTMLMKVDAPAGMGDKTYYTEQGTDYYKIEGATYKAISTGDAAASITATNIRRSNLNLTKKVVDENNNPAVSSDLFTFKITVNDTQDQQVWFSVQTDANDTTTIVKDLSTNASAEIIDGAKTGFYYANSGSKITVSIQPGWNLRFTNLPNGTTYTIEEDDKDNYEFLSASIDHNGTFSVQDDTSVGTGTINESNTQYTVTYTNQATTQQVHILKTDQNGQKPLQGAGFSLYTKDGYETDPKQALKEDLVSGEDGTIDLGRLLVGEYYLVETSAPAGYITLSEPVEITVAATRVTYTQSDNSLSTSDSGVSFDEDTKTYTLTVTNKPGVTLPSTGGTGTGLFTLLGCIMILGGGALLGFRGYKRRKSRQN